MGDRLFETWWAKRAKAVTSVESGPWGEKLAALVPATVEYIRTPFAIEAELAAFAQHPTKQFDLIVIDNHGPFPRRCAELAANRLAEGGMILLDNSDQCLGQPN